MNSSAQVARIGRSHPVPGAAANEPRYPTYSQIKTGKDMFIALAAWAVVPIFVIGAVALVLYAVRHA